MGGGQHGLTGGGRLSHDLPVSTGATSRTKFFLRASFVIGIASFFTLTTAVLQGHQDPVGDVHPQVSVAEECFVVTFSNNERMGAERDSFRCIYDSDGTLVVPRHRNLVEPQGFTPAWGGGLRRFEGELSYELDEEGKLLTIRSGERLLSRSALPWPGEEPPLEMFQDFVVQGGQLIVLGTLPHPDGHHHGAILTLHRFELDSSEAPLALTLGRVATIYDFPTASPLLLVGGRLALAWMGRPEDSEDHQFSLSTVDPATMEPSTRRLEGDYHWNTHVAIAAIGTRLCIAWHDGEIYGLFRKAKIRVLFEDLFEE